MHKLAIALAGFGSWLLVTGCDWSAGGSDSGYNSRYNWVNFNGVYRSTAGGVLVTDYSTTPAVSAITTNSFNRNNENIGTQNGSSDEYSGILDEKPVRPGSVTIRTGAVTLNDNGSGGLSGGGATGSINYETGSWSIDLNLGISPSGTAIFADYSYLVTSGGGSGGSGSGASGKSIYTFSVSHQGQNVEIVDNNGAVYTGKMGSTQVNEGTQNGSTGPVAGDLIVMQFSVSGTSAAGKNVKISGVFQGVVASYNGTTVNFAQRQMLGTWIETNGRTGDIVGTTSSITLSAPDGPPPAP